MPENDDKVVYETIASIIINHSNESSHISPLADASTCKEGERWDVGLGRCVMNRSTSELQGDVTVCGSFSNPEDRQDNATR
jgi:hypothetical protein